MARITINNDLGWSCLKSEEGNLNLAGLKENCVLPNLLKYAYFDRI